VTLGTSDEEARFTRLETTVWGPHGENGLNGEVKKLRREVGELFGRDEALRKDVNAKLDDIYKLMATLIVTILVGAGGVIATLLVTAK
jgi:hypothetical protein